MMGGSVRLGKVLGITIQLHFSWFIIFALITFSLSLSFLTEHSLWVRVTIGVLTSVLLFASVVAHELAHSIVAIRNGIPVRSITLFFLGGVAHVTREPARPKTELLVAIAGPLCSLLLAGIFWLVWFLAWGDDEETSPFENPVFWLAWINLMLALFNLVPGFPLDGGRVLRAIVWRVSGDYKKASHIASLVGRGVAFVMIGAGVAIVLGSMFYEGLSAFSGIWFAFIGWFLHQAATASYRQVELREALRHFKARAVMDTSYVVVPPNLSLGRLVQGYVLLTGRRHFVVADQGKLVGVTTFDHIKTVSRDRWDVTPVSVVMVPADKVTTVDPEEEALSVLERMDELELSQVPVVKDGVVLGTIVRDSLLHFIRLRSELGV